MDNPLWLANRGTQSGSANYQYSHKVGEVSPQKHIGSHNPHNTVSDSKGFFPICLNIHIHSCITYKCLSES